MPHTRAGLTLRIKLGHFQDDSIQMGLTGLANKAIFYLGDRHNKTINGTLMKDESWAQLTAQYAIDTQAETYFDTQLIGAQFDTRGLEYVMEHLARGLDNPVCEPTDYFNIEEIGHDI